MILLDTNVVSEALMKTTGRDPAVVNWLNGEAIETLYISSITLAEVLFGITVLPEGKRKLGLASSFDRLLALFEHRILPFDTEAAKHYSRLAAKARAEGRGFPTPDGYIAAIAAANGFSVATRDTSPFEAGGIAVINPWLTAEP